MKLKGITPEGLIRFFDLLGIILGLILYLLTRSWIYALVGLGGMTLITSFLRGYLIFSRKKWK
ncbi:MAG: hypothetical protein ABIM31_00320 [candidate division WOR-3 bacterium]